MKQSVVTFLLVLGIIFSAKTWAQTRINYPNPVGHVNDFANIINSVAERNLEVKLRDYREKTSIEIAVATVPSLEGITVDEYALDLFNKWGVGDKDKDNGILILVASNDREMKIEVGYGMEPDLTDTQSGRIIQNSMIPYFKESVEASDPGIKAQKMTDGIVAGVDAVLSELGAIPFETRLEERKIAEEKRRAEEKKQAEEFKAFMVFLGLGLAALLVIGTPIFIVYRIISRRRKLKGLFQENSNLLNKCQDMIREANNKYPEAQKALEDLKKETPADVWRSLAGTVNLVPGNIKSFEDTLGKLTKLNQSNGWEKSEDTFAAISSLQSAILGSLGLAALIRSVNNEFIQARNQSPELLKKTIEDIKNSRGELAHKDVSDKARQYLTEATNKCASAASSIHELPVNWLSVYGIIMAAAGLVAKAKSIASSDKIAAEEARRPKPVYRPSSPGHRSSRSSSGSRSSGGGGFRGFSGGRSGGGGARGKW